jgi:hypothetical protein
LHPFNEYSCTCANGAWACNVTSQGGSICSCDGGGVYPDVPEPCPPPPPVVNDPRCPASYSMSYFMTACSPIGLTCGYPGAGDPSSNGCPSTAMMWCRGDGGADDPDGGGTGVWVVAQ